jgi:hypothetical protein
MLAVEGLLPGKRNQFVLARCRGRFPIVISISAFVAAHRAFPNLDAGYRVNSFATLSNFHPTLASRFLNLTFLLLPHQSSLQPSYWASLALNRASTRTSTSLPVFSRAGVRRALPFVPYQTSTVATPALEAANTELSSLGCTFDRQSFCVRLVS